MRDQKYMYVKCEEVEGGNGRRNERRVRHTKSGWKRMRGNRDRVKITCKERRGIFQVC